jgi:hypothetical protein
MWSVCGPNTSDGGLISQVCHVDCLGGASADAVVPWARPATAETDGISAWISW